MPKHPVHRLSDTAARFECGRVTLCIGGTTVPLTIEQAKRVGAVLAAALCDERGSRRPRNKGPCNG